MSRIIGTIGSLYEPNNRLLDDGVRGSENGISAAQYEAMAKVSKATATRHLSILSRRAVLSDYPAAGAARVTKYSTWQALKADPAATKQRTGRVVIV